MMVRCYFDKYTRYNPNKWNWQPYTYVHNCSLEEQNEWNEIYLKTRARKSSDDKIISDFTSVEKDADQFDLREVTFTDIFGLKWSGKKGCEEIVESPDYEGHLYYYDLDDEPFISDEYNEYDNPPNPNIYFKFKVGYPRFRTEWIDIANITDINYHYYVENHLFKDSRIDIYYGEEREIIYDAHFKDFVKALLKFNKKDLYEKLMKQINEHFDKLKNSDREEEREYYPNCSAEEYFKED